MRNKYNFICTSDTYDIHAECQIRHILFELITIWMKLSEDWSTLLYPEMKTHCKEKSLIQYNRRIIFIHQLFINNAFKISSHIKHWSLFWQSRKHKRRKENNIQHPEKKKRKWVKSILCPLYVPRSFMCFSLWEKTLCFWKWHFSLSLQPSNDTDKNLIFLHNTFLKRNISHTSVYVNVNVHNKMTEEKLVEISEY